MNVLPNKLCRVLTFARRLLEFFPNSEDNIELFFSSLNFGRTMRERIRKSVVCILAFAVCVAVAPGGSLGQDREPETFESVYRHIQQASGNARIDRYFDALRRFRFKLMLDVRLELTNKMLAEYDSDSSNPAGRAVALVCQALIKQDQGNYVEAFKTFESAKPFTERCQKEYPRAHYELLLSWGHALFHYGRFEESKALGEEALAFTKSHPGPYQNELRPYQILGMVAARKGMTSEALKMAGKQLEYGLEHEDVLVCASSIHKIANQLQIQNSPADEIRAWLNRGEEFLAKADANRKLQFEYSLLWGNLAIRESAPDAEQKIEELDSQLNALKDKYREQRLSRLSGQLSDMYRHVGNLERSDFFARQGRELTRSELLFARNEMRLAMNEIDRGELMQALRRMNGQKEIVKSSETDFETWHRTMAKLHEKKSRFKSACFHLFKAEEIHRGMTKGSVPMLESFFKKESELEQAELRESANQQAELLEARASLAIANRNRIGYWSVFGILALAGMFRLMCVNRLRRATQRMNKTLTLKLQEQSKELKAETDKRHQLELEAERKLRHETIGQLAAGISHDFNNLLTVITSAQETMQHDDTLSITHHQLLKLSGEATDRAKCIIRQLTSFAKAEPLEVQTVSVQRWLQASQGLFTSTLGDEIGFKVECDSKEMFVHLDECQLATAIINLLSNARDSFSGATGKKEVSLVIEKEPAPENQNLVDASEASLGRVKFIVSDIGSGIEPEMLGEVLKPYVTTKDGIGIGLGLSMVAGFVERSGGLLKINSEKSKGTQVTISFESVAPEASVAESQLSFDGVAEGVILVVDDKKLVRDSMAALLRSAGFEIAQANSGDHAVRWLETNPTPLLVLSDIRMPGRLNGIKLRRHIKERFPGVHVVLMSGHTSENIDMGTTVIEKPFKLQELLSVFEKECLVRRTAG